MSEKLRNLLDTCRVWQSRSGMDFACLSDRIWFSAHGQSVKLGILGEKRGCAVSAPHLAFCFERPISSARRMRHWQLCVQSVWVGHISRLDSFSALNSCGLGQLHSVEGPRIQEGLEVSWKGSCENQEWVCCASVELPKTGLGLGSPTPYSVCFRRFCPDKRCASELSY